MAGIGIVIVGLDVADGAVMVLKLTLNDKIGVIRPDRSKSSSLGASLSNETWKYSPPDSPIGTCLAWSLNGCGLPSARIISFDPNSTPIARRPA